MPTTLTPDDGTGRYPFASVDPSVLAESKGDRRISVCIPARNEERNLEEALRSVLALDYDNLEIDVGDAAAAVLLGKKSHREAELVALDVGTLEHLKRFLRVRLRVGGLYERLEYLEREFPGVLL